MPDAPLNLPRLGDAGEPCPACAAPLAVDQRYCLQCGARRGAPRLDPLAQAGAGATLTEPGPPVIAAGPARAPSATAALLALGRPRVLGSATALVLAFGVAVGVAAGPPAAGGLPLVAAPRIVVAAAPAAVDDAAGVTAQATDTGGDAGGDLGGDVAEAAPADAAAATGDTSASPAAGAAPADDTTGGDAPATGGETPAATTPAPPAPVKHVWLIALREAPADMPFTTDATSTVAPELLAQGTVLTRYRSIAPGSLANRIALISGQAPTAATLADCPTYARVTPGTITAKTGLVTGDGCLYPPKALTLTDQLTGAGLTWKGYFEDMGAAPSPAETSCRHPQAGEADPFALPRPGDAYLTRSDPFVYFRSITESPDCGSSVVGLDRLAPDLEQAAQTPAFSFIAPSACHDGSATPCTDAAPAGLEAANAWLSTVVPQITASPAYADGGLVVITFDGTAADPAATGEPQGSTVGALLLSPYVAAGATVATAYDHYALLRTIERVFGLAALGHAADERVHAFGRAVFVNAGTD